MGLSPQPQTCDLLGCPLAVTDYSRAVACVNSWAAERTQPRLVAAANTHVVALFRRDPEFRRSLRRFDLILPDGMPLVWCMNRKCQVHLSDRVYGPTFMLRCLAENQDRFRHFLFGGSNQLLALLCERLHEKFPALQIAGSYAPPFGEWDEAEDERIITAMRNSAADFFWIGLGCPKQELWLARNRDRLPAGVYSAVGAAFAFHAGQVKQAPPWLQRNGLEWAFRLASEPRRLARRYLVYNSLFLFYLALDLLMPARARRD
jgi:N-acetylglucosaminyldiphosphoundecaprenol N-acetyl-beta-D-mannosaminyltransferase